MDVGGQHNVPATLPRFKNHGTHEEGGFVGSRCGLNDSQSCSYRNTKIAVSEYEKPNTVIPRLTSDPANEFFG